MIFQDNDMTASVCASRPPVHYTITPANPSAHIFHVTCTVTDPEPSGQLFSLPVWIPGSYMVREFSRNIVTMSAHCNGRAVELEKIDKCSWRAGKVPPGAPLELAYDVYAWDLSVRAAHLDQTHGFFNGTSVFLAVAGPTDRPCLIDIRAPAMAVQGKWRVATTLPEASGERGAARRMGFGRYRAADYDELVDHPVEMSAFTHAAFDVHGVSHEIVLSGRHNCDVERLCADLQKICAWQIDLFGAPPPFSRYLFIAMLVGEGYGGLEHRASTALLASRSDLPFAGMQGTPESYRRFLGLCSHEYFHAWNIKRIRPAAFTPYDFSRENYTRLLWAFEGITSYYDDLALARSGVVSGDDYLSSLAQTVSALLRGAGRFKQSVADSSFDAWTKFYRQDENAPNAIVSYYGKGSLIALALDLQLRNSSGGRCSLDDLMRLLWRRHGETGRGVGEDEIFAAVGEIGEEAHAGGGRKLARWLRQTVDGTGDLPLAKLLRPFAVDLQPRPASATPVLGLRLAAGHTEAVIANVYDGGPAQRAGLSAGDVLLAFGGLKVTANGLEGMLARRRVGERVEAYAFRRDELMRFELELAAAPFTSASLSPSARASAAAKRLRRGWLGS